MPVSAGGAVTSRAVVYRLLTDGEVEQHGSRNAVTGLILLAIVVMVASAMISTLPQAGASALAFVRWGYPIAAAGFLLEFLGRFWSAPEGAPRGRRDVPIGQTSDTPSPALSSRLAYLFSFLGIVDLAAMLPLWISLLLPNVQDGILIAAVFAVLKLVRYIPGMSLVAAVIRSETQSLFAALAAVGVLLLVSSIVMYVCERNAQPQIFASIPHTLWWGITSIATIGYGDMVPSTVLGKIFGGITMLLGIAMFAVPAGILATGFATELRKREFVVTWRTVARVPLFADLDASQIASVANLLRSHVVPADSVIVRRGDAAQAMFFLMEGEVEVDVLPKPVRLLPGDFFGEIALLRDLRRVATVAAVTECRLLVLDVADFRRLMEQYPELRREMERTAAERLGT
jgi:voltage-gated potassium channel